MRHRKSSVYLICLMVSFGLTLFALRCPPAAAEPRIDQLLACKDISREESIYGPFFLPHDCGSNFTSEVPSVWLFVELFLDRIANIEATLLDPNGQEAWAWKGKMGTKHGYNSWWILGLLPTSIDPKAVTKEHPKLPRKVTQKKPLSNAIGVIRLQGKPAHDRPGEWTLIVSVQDGPSGTLRFTLK